MNKSAKIVFIVAAVMTLVGIIICIAAYATASNKGNLGFDVNIKATVTTTECDTAYSSITIVTGSTAVTSKASHCSMGVPVEPAWEAANDPPLRNFLHFYPVGWGTGSTTTEGTYTITSSLDLWVVDSGEEIGEAVGGIMAAGAIMVVGIIIFVVGLILSCVGCCCLCMGEKS